MSATTLQRETFQLSRTLEFFSEKELTTQMGFSKADWPIALLKELLDNALDACESAGIAPVIAVDLEDDALTVTDNGPGLPLAVLRQSLDYTIRVSDKNGYVSPSRGQQGNALKTLWAAPFAATGEGRIDVQTADYCVEVRVNLDRIAQAPRLELIESGGNVKTGTKITLHWRGIAGYLKRDDWPDFYSVVYGLIDFNPHCALAIDGKPFEATDPAWTHWLPNQPTSPHWYQPESFRHLISLLLNAERRGGKARTINEFVRDFHGLTATAKAKAIASQAGLTGAMLHDLIVGDDISKEKSAALLIAMKADARPVKADALGILGKAHCESQIIAYGATTDSVEYRKAIGDVDGLPYAVEVVFGVKANASRTRTLSMGINFSPALSQPFYALDTALNDARCTRHDPVVILIHLACPAVQFSDRGKSKAILPRAIADDLQRLVKLVTARFTKAKRQADKNDRMNERDLEELQNAHKVKSMTVKAAAYQVMEAAYLKASSNGTLPANARQIMYAARPLIIELTGKASPWKGSSTFTQVLLNDFISENPDLCEKWDVVFDDRGHFAEPHTGNKIGIGTLAVRGYVNGWHDVIQQNMDRVAIADHLATTGPALRYRYVLFIEKEGFTPLLERARIAERYDLAIMSTKGMSVTAARKLVEALSDQNVTIFVLHDFDKSGFTILHTLCNDTRRYQFKTKPTVIDLGLRLADVEAFNLESESVEYSSDPRSGLAKSGATADEIKFLVAGENDNGRWIGQRVELNAMDSATFTGWLEEKLIAHGVNKFIPDHEALKATWQKQWRIARLNEALAKAADAMVKADIPDPPDDLMERVKLRLEDCPALAWDQALAGIKNPRLGSNAP